MNCKKCKKLINLYVDDCISDSDYKALSDHIKTCEECNNYYNLLNHMVEDLHSIEDAELPEGYANKLHFALKRAKDTKGKGIITRQRKMLLAGLSAAACLILIISSVSIVGNNSMMMKDEAMEAPMLEAMEMNEADGVLEEAPEEPAVMAEVEEEMPAEEVAEDRTTDEDTAENELAGGDIADGTEKSESSACNTLTHGNSVVIHLDVDDIDAVYNELCERLNPIDPKPSWELSTDEPDNYRAIRCLDDVDIIYNYEIEIIQVYKEYVDSYYTAEVEYDKIETELVGLHNHGYLFIVIK